MSVTVAIRNTNVSVSKKWVLDLCRQSDTVTINSTGFCCQKIQMVPPRRVKKHEDKEEKNFDIYLTKIKKTPTMRKVNLKWE